MNTITDTESCGCEFTTYSDYIGSFMTLTKCRCLFHYKDQMVAEWFDAQGEHHKIVREPSEVAGLIQLDVTQ